MTNRPDAAPSDLWQVPLSPVNFLRRSAVVFGDRLAVIDGSRRMTYGELWDRARRFAGALIQLRARPRDRVAVIAMNSHLLLEMHYSVPLAGAVLVALNPRWSADELAFAVRHSGARLLVVDSELIELGKEVAAAVGSDVSLIAGGQPDDEYESLIRGATALDECVLDEWSLIAINYTSGTTGRPKGVMCQYRGAYLQSLAMAYHLRLYPESVYLWTLPMFHCNGWCLTWAVTAAGATHVCMRQPAPADVWQAVRNFRVTHLSGAPTVLTMLANDPAAAAAEAPILASTGGAPPSPTLLLRLAELNIEVTHLYGLTESFGPAVISEWRPEWRALPLERQSRLKARQGVGNLVSEPVRVIDQQGHDVVADGTTIGEIILRGNNIMLGYFDDPAASHKAAPDGWFRTGDLGVLHPDGYVEIRDRAKDLIISGGENIASVEVEQVVLSHPGVLEAAVVSMPHELWGEVPAAFVTLKVGVELSEGELIDYVRKLMPHFMAPKRVIFGPLPKTSTGKVQKYALRARLQA